MIKNVEILSFDTYLAVIRGSVGARLFRSSYLRIGRKRLDALEGGNLSCAFFVTFILKALDLIEAIHTTVTATEADLGRSRWRKVRTPKAGDVLVWEMKKLPEWGEPHRHVGFYVGGGKAVSNDSKLGVPKVHGWTFGKPGSRTHRRIEAIYRMPAARQ